MPSRKELLRKLEETRESRVICYITGDRGNQETQIGDDVLPNLAQHLGKIGKTRQIDLLIYSRGGNTLTGFTFANALREFGSSVHVLVPFRAHSCATLISLGANRIIAGPFAQLSPIDPSISTPHGPTIQQGTELKFLPVSVEDVANYFELARKEAGIEPGKSMVEALSYLCQRVSPLALGAVYRAREQIGMLATKLLSLHMTEEDKINRIVKQLTRELLSHDYIINRREAKSIGLPVSEAPDDQAELMWQLYEDVAGELKLNEPWNWQKESQAQQPRTSVRAVLESRELKHVFTSTYQIKRVSGSQDGRKTETLNITPTEETWKKA